MKGKEIRVEVTKDGGTHALSGIRLVKGEQHQLPKSQAGGYRNGRFVLADCFKEVDGPHPDEAPAGEEKEKKPEKKPSGQKKKGDK